MAPRLDKIFSQVSYLARSTPRRSRLIFARQYVAHPRSLELHIAEIDFAIRSTSPITGLSNTQSLFSRRPEHRQTGQILAGKNIPLATSHLGRCTRAPFCEKVPSHSGFCSGPRDRRQAGEESAKSGRQTSPWPAEENRDDPKPVASYPLTEADVASGQAGLPTLDLQCSQIWAEESITVKVSPPPPQTHPPTLLPPTNNLAVRSLREV
jgi:hypothetical protein